MGIAELLTREGEINIARRIEDGIGRATAVAEHPGTIAFLLKQYDLSVAEEARITTSSQVL